jgi:hypothetical protein
VTNEEAAANSKAEEVEIIAHILMRPGPFTTPRAVYKSIRYSMRSKAQQKFQDIVKSMEKDGIGCYLDISSNESAYYKPLPVEENKVKVESLLGKATWDEYGVAFRKKEVQKLMSSSQHDRLLSNSPHVDKLHEYGF